MERSLTQGGALVAALARRVGAATMARRVGLTEAAIRSHATGGAVPRPGVRDRYARHYDVPSAAWTTPADGTPPVSPSAPSSPAAALPSSASPAAATES